MKYAWIDLGSHFGSITRRFIESPLYHADFELHAFEGNPIITQDRFDAYPSGVEIHQYLAWTFDGAIEFYLTKGQDPRVQGSSVFREKITGNLDPENPVIVPCLDFSAWLADNFEEGDQVIVKSNIEGAEYDLFEKLIDDGTIRIIRRLHLRRHWQKCGIPEERDRALVAALEGMSDRLTLRFDYNFES